MSTLCATFQMFIFATSKHRKGAPNSKKWWLGVVRGLSRSSTITARDFLLGLAVHNSLTFPRHSEIGLFIEIQRVDLCRCLSPTKFHHDAQGEPKKRSHCI